MNQEYSKQLSYDLMKKGSAPQRQAATVEYVEVPPLPTGKNLESMFKRAVVESPDEYLRGILNDLFRYLVFANHVHFGLLKGRPANLALLNSQYPFAGRIVEAQEYIDGAYTYWKTDACGAVLDLVDRTQSSREVKLRIGGILFAMLVNETVIKGKRKPYFPVIAKGR